MMMPNNSENRVAILESTEWVMKAMDSKSLDRKKHHIHIKGNKTLGTDGKRCHIHTMSKGTLNPNIKDGAYRVEGKGRSSYLELADQDLEFFPVEDRTKHMISEEYRSYVEIDSDRFDQGISTLFGMIIKKLGSKSSINYKYVLDAVKGFNWVREYDKTNKKKLDRKYKSVNIYMKDNSDSDPVILTNGDEADNKKAVIMPIKMY